MIAVVRAARGSWRSWVVPAAGIWSCLVCLFGVLWATDLVGSPFGVNDPRAGEVGSYLEGMASRQVGWIAITLGLTGALAAFAAWRLPNHRWPAIPGLSLSFVLLLVVPDIRVIQNFAYLFFGYIGLWDAALGAMMVSVVGGLLWALAAIAQLTRGRGPLATFREPRWAVPMTYAAGILALPYPIVRIAWALGVPLGMPGDYVDGWGWLERLGVGVVFGGLPVGGAILTIGLVRPWGEVFPRWIPRLRRSRVPIAAVVVPGMWAALLLSQMGLRVTTWAIADLGEMSWDSWGAGLPGLFFLPWGVTLAAAVYAYAVRRSRHDKRDWAA